MKRSLKKPPFSQFNTYSFERLTSTETYTAKQGFLTAWNFKRAYFKNTIFNRVISTSAFTYVHLSVISSKKIFL
jgi:hypothetical protein